MQNRNRTIVIAAVASLLLASGYTGACWYVGKQVEAQVEAGYRKLDGITIFSVKDRQYQRGLFSSTETVTFNLGGKRLPMPLSFTVVSKISHLPLLGLVRGDVASAESRANFAAGTMPGAAELIGDKDLMQVRTRIGFRGGMVNTLIFPAYQTARLSSEEGKLEIDVSPGMERYTLGGRVPRMTFTPPDGSKIQISDITFGGENQLLLKDVPGLYAGNTRVTLGQLEVSVKADQPGMVMKNFVIDMTGKSVDNGKSMDVLARYTIDAITGGPVKIGPTRLEVYVNHLDTRTYGKFVDFGWRDIEPDPAMLKDLETLLLNKPEAGLDLSLTLPEGDTTVAAKVWMEGLQPGELASGDVKLWDKRGRITVDVRSPEKVVLGPGAFVMGMLLHVPVTADSLRQLQGAGFIEREGDNLKSHIEFRDGAYLLNGKPYTAPAQARPAPGKR